MEPFDSEIPTRLDGYNQYNSTGEIPNGSYRFPKIYQSPEENNPLNFRLVIFVTTHVSEAHIWYLLACWPLAMESSQLLTHADVIVYLSMGSEVDRDRRRHIMTILQHRFENQTLTIQVRDNHGYQEGALAAMKEAVEDKWFERYDWVIRLNPDVIMRNESFILETMRNDQNATAILIDCDVRNPLKMIHTDFFAIKPSVFSKDAFMNVTLEGGMSAEVHFSHDIREAVIDKGNHRWVPGSQPLHHTCRAGFQRRMETADVVHHHLGADLSRPWARMPEPNWKDLKCPIPF